MELSLIDDPDLEFLRGCADCLAHWVAEPFLVEAFASVGIERGHLEREVR